ncbi:MAG: HAD hydrolase-like protein [Niameybacter sp.]
MKRTFDAVIFDLDGTLIDSMWVWSKIDEAYLGRYGLEVEDSFEAELEGKSFTETAVYVKERFQISESVEEIKAEWNKMVLSDTGAAQKACSRIFRICGNTRTQNGNCYK